MLSNVQQHILLVFALVLFATIVVAAEGVVENIEFLHDPNITPSFAEDELIDLSLDVHVSGVLPSTIRVFGEIGNQEQSISLSKLFDLESIEYTDSGGQFEADNPVDNVFLIYTDAGTQTVNIKLSSSEDTVQSMDMRIIGFPTPDDEYVTFPSMDIDADGTPEWQYFGNLEGFSDTFVLPLGLEEDTPGLRAHITGEEIYYCEVIDFPFAKDFEISANVAPNVSIDDAALHATVFSYVGSGDTITAFGGPTFDCAFPIDHDNSQQMYSSCVMHLNYSIQGKHLACIYNNNPNKLHDINYFLQLDDPIGESAYSCVPSPQSGEFDCDKQDNGDYFIKLKTGEYSSELKGPTTFSKWLVELPSVFLNKLNEHVEDCVPVTGGCVVSIAIAGESAGILSLDNLNVIYKSGNTEFSSDKFYELTSTGGFITHVAGNELGENSSFSISTKYLTLFGPEVSKDSNHTFEVSFDPGPSESTTVLITQGADTPTTSSNVPQLITTIDGYIDLFTLERNSYLGILEALGIRADINTAINTLQQYRTDVLTLNASGDSNISAALATIDTAVLDLIQSLPQLITVQQSADDVFLAQPTDIIDAMVLSGTATEDERLKVYYAQEKFTVDAHAEYFSATFFDASSSSSTAVSKQLSGSGTNFVVFEVLPPGISSSDIEFDPSFTLVQSSPNIVYKKTFSTLSSASYSYHVQDNVVSDLGSFLTIIVPQQLTGGEPSITPVCGDGVCTVLEVEGEFISLEDARSCPEDCAKPINWVAIFIVVFIGILIIAGVNFYTKHHKTGNGKTLKLNTKLGKTSSPLFRNAKDEVALLNYVKTAIKKGMNKNDINKTLLQRGWKKTQVDHIFRKIGSGTSSAGPVKKTPTRKITY